MLNYVLTVFMGLAGFGFAQTPETTPVLVSAGVDKAIASSSESITFSVILKTSQEYANLSIPEFGDSIVGFRVVDFGVDPAETDDNGYQVTRRWYTLESDISGSYVLPAVKIQYGDKTASTSEIFVEITPPGQTKDGENSEGDAPSQDIRDIKGLVPTAGLSPAVIIGGAVLIVILCLGLGYYIWQKRRQGKDRTPEIEPHILATQDLEKLRASSFLDEDQVKAFHFSLSEIMRRYFEGQFGFPATDRTIEEINRDIHSVTTLNEKDRNDFLAILKETEVVKFADIDPGKEKSLDILDLSENFVNDTKPATEASPESVI